MYKHPLVYFLAKRIDRLMFIPFGLTAGLFFFSFCHHTYPGHSAMLVAEAARLTPSLQPAHGLFSTLTHLIAALDFLSLPTRLNLFSVFCGCLSATLFFRLLARTILIYGYDPYEDEANAWPEDEAVAPHSFNTVIKKIGDYNQKLLTLAIRSSLAATVLLALMAPFWLATTHLNEPIFNLLLVLVIFSLFPYQETPLCHLRFLFATLLFTIGCFESVVVVMLFPIMALMTFAFYMRMENRMLVLAHTVFGGFAGIMIAFYLRQTTPDTVFNTLLVNLEDFLRTVVYHHADECLMLFAGKGWLLSLFQTAFPAALLLFGKDLMFYKWTGRAQMASVLILAAAIPAALNLAISPFALSQEVDYLPVFSSVMLAATMAFVFVTSSLFFVPKISTENFNKEVFLLEEEGPPPASKKPATLFISLLVFLALITPFRSLPYVQASKSQFADCAAREIITVMGERSWLITNGQLDNHLRIQAHLFNRPLNVVTLRQEADDAEQRLLQKLIRTDHTFQHLNRPRLLNALSIGTLRFSMEWLTSDTNICRTVMVFGAHELWTACKLRALPHGMAFGGFHSTAVIDTKPLIETSITLEKQLTPLLLTKNTTASPIPANLSALIRLKMGYTINELGALLEDLDQPDEAFYAYQRATQIDPDNISALLNAYALAKGGKVKSTQIDAMRQRLRLLLQDRAQSRLGLQGLFLNYGTIHQKEFYEQEAEAWIARGAQAIAAGKISKALDLSQQTGASTLIERAHYYSLSGKPTEAEACYLAVLEQDSTDFKALYGMTILMINNNDIPKAEHWLKRATATKKETNIILLYPTILIAIKKGDTTRADTLLAEATKNYPQDERFWKLRAVFLLKLGDVIRVRHNLLPEMMKAFKNPEHYLIHIVRGLVWKAQGEAYYRDARISLLKGLSLNASMAEVWNTVLEIDMLIGSLELIETDIHHLLMLDPDHAQANYMKGSIQLARGHVESAEDFIRRSIEKAPSAVACNDLAEILRLQKKLKEAKDFAHQALTIDPNLTQARETLSAILADTEKEALK